jgi:hypothetical protein
MSYEISMNRLRCPLIRNFKDLFFSLVDYYLFFTDDNKIKEITINEQLYMNNRNEVSLL